MAITSDITFVGARADGSNTLGSAVGVATLTTDECSGFYLIPTGGPMTFRRADEDAEEDVSWPENLPLTTEGFREILGTQARIPSLIITIPADTTVSGWVTGGSFTVS